MRSVGLLVCVALVAGVLMFLSVKQKSTRGRTSAQNLPTKIEFTASRSTEDPADVEIAAITFTAKDGSQHAANTTTVAFVRAGGKEQQVATLKYG